MDLPITVAGWSNQADTFLTMIDTYRTKELFCDCTIACREKLFRTHKIVLSMSSVLFESILLNTQDKNPVIILQDIEAWQLESLLNFMYKGETQVVDEKFASLLKVAKYLKIKGFDQVKSLRNMDQDTHWTSYSNSQIDENKQQEVPLNMSLPIKRNKTSNNVSGIKNSHVHQTTSNHNQQSTSPTKVIDNKNDYKRPIQRTNKRKSFEIIEDHKQSINTTDEKGHNNLDCRGLPKITEAMTSHNLKAHSIPQPYPPNISNEFGGRTYPNFFNHDNHRNFFKKRDQGHSTLLFKTPPVAQQSTSCGTNKTTVEQMIKTEEQLYDKDVGARVETFSSDEETITQKYKEEYIDEETMLRNESSQSKIFYAFNNNQYIKPQSTCLRKLPPLLKIPTSSIYEGPGKKLEFKSLDPLLEKIPTNKRKRVRGPKSWEYLHRLLKSSTSNPSLIKWEDKEAGIFRLIQPEVIAQRWGQRTGKHIQDVLSYESFSRGLRYHYATGALCAVSEKSFVYQFGPKAHKHTLSNVSSPPDNSTSLSSPVTMETSS